MFLKISSSSFEIKKVFLLFFILPRPVDVTLLLNLILSLNCTQPIHEPSPSSFNLSASISQIDKFQFRVNLHQTSRSGKHPPGLDETSLKELEPPPATVQSPQMTRIGTA